MPTVDYATLAQAARQARQYAYAPYSGFWVGAALLAEDGTIYTGANVENAAYGVACCAERVALFSAVSHGAQQFRAIAIAGAPQSASANEMAACPPCGICRQALSEFCRADMPVVLAIAENQYEVHTLGQLLPLSFGPQCLSSQ